MPEFQNMIRDFDKRYCPAKRCHHHFHGFMLLMVLVTIVVVGVALTTTARRSLLASIAGAESQQAAQRHWGMISCQRVFLVAAPRIFEVSDRVARMPRGKKSAPPSKLQDRVLLGGNTFNLLLADEDAKADLNSIYDFANQRECQRALTRLCGPIAARTVALRPSRESLGVIQSREIESQSKGDAADDQSSPVVTASVATRAFRSWGEVFDLVQVNRLAGDDRQLATMTRELTLFGTGKINLFRASDEAILAVCGSVIEDGLAKRLLEKLRSTSLRETELILEQTVIKEDDRKNLIDMLGESSNSFSLWIEATGQRSRKQRLAIITPDTLGRLKTIEFSFE
jgi:type II secretory pathway pseudopilin PulG